MKAMTRLLKNALRPILPNLGLYEYFLRIKRLRDPETRYRRIKRFKAKLNGVTVQFSTEDEYSNWWFFPRYAAGRIHEKKVTEMFLEALRGAKCFVDVGTNLGWYTCLASKHMSYGKVYGFEMDDLNFAVLQRNLAVNHCSNVEVHNLAVSDSSGVVSYKRDSDRPHPGFQLRPSRKDDDSIEFVSVNSVALDDFLESKGVVPDVIKIDVEGAEMRVLTGLRRTLRKCTPILFVEIHPEMLQVFDASTSAILSLLIANNYKVFEIESMRDQESKKQLKPLSQDSVIQENTMLYATRL